MAAASIAEEISAFESTLPPAERAVFRSGHRLSRLQRDSLLSGFSKQEIEQQMWRFADEPAHVPAGPAADAARRVREVGPQSAPPPRSMRADTILMDLWHASDDPAFLLELECCVDALAHGVNLLFDGDRRAPVFQRNHGSARHQAKELRAAVAKAVSKGFCVGPFRAMPWPNLVTHPLGIVPKSEGGYRLVEDASMPQGDSVNDWTADVEQEYERWDAVLDHLLRAQTGCFFLHFDKDSAYRSVPLRLVDQHLTGFHIPGDGHYYSANLPFGFKASAYLWLRFMRLFLLLLSRRLGVPLDDLHFWVDDALLVLSPCVTDALAVYLCLIEAARRYSFWLHPVKLFLARRVTYLGIVIDSVSRTLSIPHAKREEVKLRLRKALQASSWSKLTLQRVLGSLQHVGRALPHALPFLGRLIAAVRANPGPQQFTPPAWALDDLRAWLSILGTWSGTSLVRLRAPSSEPDITFFVDAFGGSTTNDFAGIGIFCPESGSHAMQEFTARQRELVFVDATFSTLLIEFSALVWLLTTFRNGIQGKVVRVRCDNKGAITVAQKGYHADPVLGGFCRLLASL